MQRRFRRGRSTGGAVLLVIVLVIAGGVALFGPKYMHFMEMKEIARAAAAEWHVTEDIEVGKRHLAQQMEKRQMPLYIPDDACRFSEEDGYRYVTCYWDATVTIPLINHPIPQSYEFTTEMDKSGKLQQW